ncbi:MAG: uncharacterized protein A8A55_3388 [Amphiamblys sp. WSBS2006]|nr:MAG: uncharacterized protein A8A55_3388 [Amphiamblys sp. WSBS2006]
MLGECETRPVELLRVVTLVGETRAQISELDGSVYAFSEQLRKEDAAMRTKMHTQGQAERQKDAICREIEEIEAALSVFRVVAEIEEKTAKKLFFDGLSLLRSVLPVHAAQISQTGLYKPVQLWIEEKTRAIREESTNSVKEWLLHMKEAGENEIGEIVMESVSSSVSSVSEICDRLEKRRSSTVESQRLFLRQRLSPCL